MTGGGATRKTTVDGNDVRRAIVVVFLSTVIVVVLVRWAMLDWAEAQLTKRMERRRADHRWIGTDGVDA